MAPTSAGKRIFYAPTLAQEELARQEVCDRRAQRLWGPWSDCPLFSRLSRSNVNIAENAVLQIGNYTVNRSPKVAILLLSKPNYSVHRKRFSIFPLTERRRLFRFDAVFRTPIIFVENTYGPKAFLSR